MVHMSRVQWATRLDPFGAHEPLPILNPSNFVPKNGFPAVTGSREVWYKPKIAILTSLLSYPD